MDIKRIRVETIYDLQVLTHLIRHNMTGSRDKADEVYAEKMNGLSSANIFILSYVYINQGREVYQKDLEDALNVRRSTISKVLQGMEKKGLLYREQADHDARLKCIVLTQDSLNNISHWMRNFERLAEKVTAGFAQEELEQFTYLIRKATKNMED